MRLVAALGYSFDSLYIGGGTPTVSIDELCRTIDLARELFGMREVSCETNPGHLRPDIIEKLSPRVQRLSVGIQSFDDDLLCKMGRTGENQCGETVFREVQSAVGAFPSLNTDMIFNFPAQTEEILRGDVERLRALGANQATFYPLMTSPGVASSIKQTLGRVDYTREAAYYELLCNLLSKDFEPTTAWNFSRQGGGLIDEYIVDTEEYIGVGSGSFSYLDGKLFVNTFSLREYDQALAAGRAPISSERRFGLRDRMRYRFLMQLFGLRLDKQRFLADFGVPVDRALWPEITFMRLAGAFARENSQEITLSNTGRYLVVAMMREFFSGVNHLRDQARAALRPADRWEAECPTGNSGSVLVGELSGRPSV